MQDAQVVDVIRSRQTTTWPYMVFMRSRGACTASVLPALALTGSPLGERPQ